MIRRGLLAVVACIAVGCSAMRCSPAGVPLIQAVHVSAGDAPFITKLAVFEDGTLRVERLGKSARCGSAAQPLGRLIAAAHSPEVSAEALEVNAQPGHAAPPDWERVAVQVAGSTFTVAVEREPAATARLLREMDGLFRQTFGRRYDISLVPRGRESR